MFALNVVTKQLYITALDAENNGKEMKSNMGCFWLDEWRECDDCPYFSECPDSDDNREEST